MVWWLGYARFQTSKWHSRVYVPPEIIPNSNILELIPHCRRRPNRSPAKTPRPVVQHHGLPRRNPDDWRQELHGQ